jgi:transcriptional regulator with XRE-family HTH domain
MLVEAGATIPGPCRRAGTPARKRRVPASVEPGKVLPPHPDVIDEVDLDRPIGHMTAAQGRAFADQLSDELRTMRVKAGLTGLELAGLAGFRQSKQSKVECGTLLPSVLDVQRWATACGASKDARDRVAELCGVLNTYADSPRAVVHRGVNRIQRTVLTAEADAQQLGEFASHLVPPLLRTEDYAWAFHIDQTNGLYGLAELERRQKALGVLRKRFAFVLLENVFRLPLMSTAVMTGQIDHIMSLATRPNIDIAIVPATVATEVPPLTGFQVYDRTMVVIDLPIGNVVITNPSDVVAHLQHLKDARVYAVRGRQALTLLTEIKGDYALSSAGWPVPMVAPGNGSHADD